MSELVSLGPTRSEIGQLTTGNDQAASVNRRQSEKSPAASPGWSRLVLVSRG